MEGLPPLRFWPNRPREVSVSASGGASPPSQPVNAPSLLYFSGSSARLISLSLNQKKITGVTTNT